MEKELVYAEEAEPPGRGAQPARVEGSPQFTPVSDDPYPLPTKTSKVLVPARWMPRFASSSRSRLFRRRFYPQASPADWNDWGWQLRNRITDLETLERILRLSEDERRAIVRHGGALPLAVTPYYASLLDGDHPAHPLRRTVVPSPQEDARASGESADPLGEDGDSPVPGLVHRYPDRVLFLVTGFCSTYCRYCTRSRMVGHHGGAPGQDVGRWEQAIAYIERTPSVRDVLLSGGDALTLSDEALGWLLGRLRRIPHVEFLRIGTKAPVVLPQRVTAGLTRMLKRFHPLWMSIHFTHPEELTPEAAQACTRLADAGIPLGSQTVLLAGINDDLDTMRRLMHGLLRIRVKPYYLYQCDPIWGSSHFRTPVSRGLELIEGLRGHTTGYAVPTYVIDAPGGGGKVPLVPNYVVGRSGQHLLLKNYQGNLYIYPDAGPFGASAAAPGPPGEAPCA